MKKSLFICLLASSVLAGCASVPMQSSQESEQLKKYNPPSSNKAGIYVYRKDSMFGAALKKDVRIDNACIGETARGVFFYHEVEGDKDHTFSTESEFSDNDLVIRTMSGQLYFVEQNIKFGAFVGGAELILVNNDQGKSDVSSLKLAAKGTCSN